MHRTLTKSRFRLAMTCPSKLYYTGKPEYPDMKSTDAFLESLADGGYQVGGLAKAYFPDGHEISSLDPNTALSETRSLLKKDRSTIFEAAFCFESFFIRADIIVKHGLEIELIEVKSKSTETGGIRSMVKQNGEINAEWLPYIEDAAFQKYVIQKAIPGFRIKSFLMTVDKSAPCPSDGLNQKFRIRRDPDGRKVIVQTRMLTTEEMDRKILRKDCIDELCDQVFSRRYSILDCESGDLDFEEMIRQFAFAYKNDIKIKPVPGAGKCAACEFRCPEGICGERKLIGFHECWKEALGWTDKDLGEPTILDIWNFRGRQKLFEQGRIKIQQVEKSDISPHPDGKPGLSVSERQWMQVLKAKDFDENAWIDRENLKLEMAKWRYPLHMIDFETAKIAIPFNKGKHPYEDIAFQFSHHMIREDGFVEHVGQYINLEPGRFPNYDFIRALMQELAGDGGSIFRYAAHENTILRSIRRQLSDDGQDLPDRSELCRFIDEITQYEHFGVKKYGARNMIDMLDLVRRYYYDPSMKGSNSIKQVLPAILNNSRFIKEKYSKPIYGADGGIPSKNYKGKTWIVFENGCAKNPYMLLRKMFEDIPGDVMELFSNNDVISEGGAASIAYARMQSEEMSGYERSEITRSLLEYCELDTLAMIMLAEGWRDLVY